MAGSETCAEQNDGFGLIGHAGLMLVEVRHLVAPISISAWTRFERVSIDWTPRRLAMRRGRFQVVWKRIESTGDHQAWQGLL